MGKAEEGVCLLGRSCLIMVYFLPECLLWCVKERERNPSLLDMRDADSLFRTVWFDLFSVLLPAKSRKNAANSKGGTWASNLVLFFLLLLLKIQSTKAWMLFKVASECSRILNNQSYLSTRWFSLMGANVVQTMFDYLAVEKKSKQNQELLKGNIWKSSKLGDKQITYLS